MNRRLSFLKLAFVAALIATGAGCTKSSKPGGLSAADDKVTGSHSDPPVLLQGQWQPSNRYAFHLDVKIDTEPAQRGPNAPDAQQTTAALDYTLTVTNALPNGGRTLEMEILALEFERYVGDSAQITLDTENRAMGADGNPITDALSRLKGARLGFLIAPPNTLVQVLGVPALQNRLAGSGARGQRFTLGQTPFNPQFFRQLVEFEPLPNRAVRIDEEWTVRRTIDAGGTGQNQAELRCTFKGWQMRDQHHCAVVTFQGAFKPLPRPPPAQGGATAVVSSSDGGTVVGKTWFDPDIRLARETSYQQVFNQPGRSRGRRGRGTNAAPQTVTMTTTQEVTLKLLEVTTSAKGM